MNYKQQSQLKELYFKNQNFTVKKTTPYNSYKDTNQILTNIIENHTSYKKVRKIYTINKIIKTALPVQYHKYVLYAFYHKNILRIATINHISQNELNYQKDILKAVCKKVKGYEDIEKINIFRDEEFYKNFYKNSKVQIEIEKMLEKGHGIFDNNLKDEKLYNIIENIRNHIIKNKRKYGKKHNKPKY